MITHIINYAIRVIIILIGIALLSGAMNPPKGDTSLFFVMGIIFLLFGIYRTVTYYSACKRTNRRREYDDE